MKKCYLFAYFSINIYSYLIIIQAPTDLLQPVHENTIEAYGFDLSYRSLEIRFRIDKTRFEFINTGKIHMKCVSQIMELPSQIRVSNHDFFVSSLDDLRNQKLINWKNSGERQITLKSLYNKLSGSEHSHRLVQHDTFYSIYLLHPPPNNLIVNNI